MIALIQTINLDDLNQTKCLLDEKNQAQGALLDLLQKFESKLHSSNYQKLDRSYKVFKNLVRESCHKSEAGDSTPRFDTLGASADLTRSLKKTNEQSNFAGNLFLNRSGLQP